MKFLNKKIECITQSNRDMDIVESYFLNEIHACACGLSFSFKIHTIHKSLFNSNPWLYYIDYSILVIFYIF